MTNDLRQAALDYHSAPRPGKISIKAIKPLTNQYDLALAYSPGVAAACEEIVANPANAFRYTVRGNLVGVITNGTAVLGLGEIGPLAAKPVMEGKSALFKKFAGIDVFDIEIDERDPAKLCDIIASLEPTFGGINLEDIKAPECFYIERELQRRMRIPVFHDDQHGTAIIVSAAVLNGITVVDKTLSQIRMVISGAGAAALACAELLVELGMPIANIWLTDLAGVVYLGRQELMDEKKARFAQLTEARTLAEVLPGADVFLGLSAGNVLKPEMLLTMGPRPLIFALANPTPEILPELAKAVRPDAIVATGRTDYPNQVNNALCFPFIFRGALDVGATTITREMEIATVYAIAALARQEQSDTVAAAYVAGDVSFGPDYLIPRLFDPRLIVTIAPAVAKAAMDSGVATRPIHDFEAYVEQLQQFVHHSGTLMKPLLTLARKTKVERKRIIFAEGEEERILRAAQVICDEKIAIPILIGRQDVIAERIERHGLRIRLGSDVHIVDTERERFCEYAERYHRLMERRGVTPEYATAEVLRRPTLIGAMLLKSGGANGMICGIGGSTAQHLRYVDRVIGKQAGCSLYASMSALILPNRDVFLVDPHINVNPNAAQLAEITRMAAREMLRFEIQPKVALLSHSNFGSSNTPSAMKMRACLAILREQAPEIEVEGEMQGDCALNEALRHSALAISRLQGAANLLVMPNIDAANIAFNLLKTAVGDEVAVGPILLGCAAPVNILNASATVRCIVELTALTVARAGDPVDRELFTVCKKQYTIAS